MNSVCFGYIYQCQDEFSVILNIFYSRVRIAMLGSGSHTHTVSGMGHRIRNRKLNIFPAAIAANIRNSVAPILYISWLPGGWRQTPHSADYLQATPPSAAPTAQNGAESITQ